MIQLQFTQGCPNGCEYCYEPKREIKYFNPNIESNAFNILDMNFLSNPNAKQILKDLPKGHYELICGIDYRKLDQEIANLLKEKGFYNIRWAWDYGFAYQKIQRKTFLMLIKAGYKPNDLSCFMICDWKISYLECCQKLDLLKVWNVKVNDCWYNGVVSPNFQCNYWDLWECKDFRKKCRKHNHLVLFKIDPELKELGLDK